MKTLCRAPEGIEYTMVQQYAYPSFAGGAYPFSATRPLLFHVLTGAPRHQAGEDYARSLVRAGVELMPADQVPGMKGLVKPRDRVAGDDEYVFLTPLSTFLAGQSELSANPQDANRPAFAFDAQMLWDASRTGFGFRVQDLEVAYASVEATDIDLTLFDDDFDDMTREEQDDLIDEHRAESAREDLECLADAGTIYGDDAWTALVIYTLRAAGLLTESDAIEEGMALVPPMPDRDFCPDAFDVARNLGLEERWRQLFAGTGNPRDTIFGSRDYRPEILYPRTIPLCCASWFRRGDGTWVPLDREWCEAGRAALNPRQQHVTTARRQR